MLIFSIETSCDDTSVAIIKKTGSKQNPRPASKEGHCKNNNNFKKNLERDFAQGLNFEVLSNIVSSQIKKHAKFGGIVPNLAARLHLENINVCIDRALKEACLPGGKAGITPKKIDLITVTRGPGLIPALLIGTQVARTLAYLWNKPIIGVNHIEGHIFSNWLTTQNVIPAKAGIHKEGIDSRLRGNDRGKGGTSMNKIEFPILNLIVSGGHTMLVLMKDHLKYKIIGQTRDDAVGESFDKVARLLDLGYPGGPIIERLAKKYRGELIDLPRPMMYSKDYDFSFSGLKTAVLYNIRKHHPVQRDGTGKEITSDFQMKMSASFQQAAFDVLIYKTLKAAENYGAKTIMLGGGVSANKELSRQFKRATAKNGSQVNFLVPDIKLSTDNAVMIAIAGFYRYMNGEVDSWQKLEANANLKLI